jgi:hypothetical protein
LPTLPKLRGDGMRFSVSCELGYRVDAPSSFVLNIQPI